MPADGGALELGTTDVERWLGVPVEMRTQADAMMAVATAEVYLQSPSR
jgi:hypothetical protein